MRLVKLKDKLLVEVVVVLSQHYLLELEHQLQINTVNVLTRFQGDRISTLV